MERLESLHAESRDFVSFQVQYDLTMIPRIADGDSTLIFTSFSHYVTPVLVDTMWYMGINVVVLRGVLTAAADGRRAVNGRSENGPLIVALSVLQTAILTMTLLMRRHCML